MKKSGRIGKEHQPPAAYPGSPLAASAPMAPERAAISLPNLVLFLVTALGIYLCWRLAQPFLESLAWALALAVLFAPLQRRLERALRFPSLAALVAVLAISLMVVVPAIFVGQRLVLQAASGAELVESKIKSGEWRAAFEAKMQAVPLFVRFEKDIDLPGIVASLAGWLSQAAAGLVQGSIFQVIGFGLTLYLLFFLLRDRVAALASLRRLLPLASAEADTLFERLGSTLRATLYGTLACSAAQGLLGGLMFWWLGLPTPLLWGVVMALLSVVPVMGAFVVWLPAALYLASEGSWGKALILVLWGVFVVGMVDNLMRPFLVGKKLDQHTVLAFLSVVGGLVFFGASGLVLGPLVLAFTTVLLEVWAARARAGEGGPAARSTGLPDQNR